MYQQSLHHITLTTSTYTEILPGFRMNEMILIHCAPVKIDRSRYSPSLQGSRITHSEQSNQRCNSPQTFNR